jgi:hypothetical protein
MMVGGSSRAIPDLTEPGIALDSVALRNSGRKMWNLLFLELL